MKTLFLALGMVGVAMTGCGGFESPFEVKQGSGTSGARASQSGATPNLDSETGAVEAAIQPIEAQDVYDNGEKVTCSWDAKVLFQSAVTPIVQVYAQSIYGRPGWENLTDFRVVPQGGNNYIVEANEYTIAQVPGSCRVWHLKVMNLAR